MCQRPRYSSPSKQGGKAGRRLGWRTSLFRSSASDVARSRHAGHIHNSYNALNQRKRLAELFLPAEVYRWGGAPEIPTGAPLLFAGSRHFTTDHGSDVQLRNCCCGRRSQSVGEQLWDSAVLLYTNPKKRQPPPQTRARPDGNVVSNHHEVRLVKVANVFLSLLRLSASVTAAPYFFINCDPWWWYLWGNPPFWPLRSIPAYYRSPTFSYQSGEPCRKHRVTLWVTDKKRNVTIKEKRQKLVIINKLLWPTIGLNRRKKASHHALGHTGVSDLGVNVDLDKGGEIWEEGVGKALFLFVETQNHLLQGTGSRQGQNMKISK